MSDLTDRLRCFDRQTCTEAAERIETLEAELAAMRAGGEPVGWKHDCAALLTNDVELWIDTCPHCGKPRHTNPQPAAQDAERIQALELEVRQLTEQAAALRKGLELAIKQNSHDMLMTGEELRQCEAALAAQQPAPSAAPDDQMIAEYGRKASRMMARDQTRFDAACEVDKYLREEGAPGYYRHRMSIILFGNVEGTEASRAPENEAPQPSPTPQADSQPAPLREGEWINDAGRIKWLMWRVQDLEAKLAARAPADSVLEDAAQLERERICAAIKAEDDYCVEHGDYMLDSDDCIKIARSEWVRPDYLVDAARKQGANHD